MMPENVLKWRQRRDQIREFQYARTVPVDDLAIYETLEHEGFDRATRQGTFKPFAVGKAWGREWSTAWFRVRFQIPKAFAGERVVFRFDPGPGTNSTCYTRTGEPLQGVDVKHSEILLGDPVKGGERYTLIIESGSQVAHNRFNEKPRLAKAELATVDRELRSFYWDYDALLELIVIIPGEQRRRATLARGLEESINTLLVDGFEPAAARRHAKAARAVLRPLLQQPAHASTLNLAAIGHAHIDVAWLWPLRETVRKCSRTFATICKYLEEYPHFKFTQSQPQLYAFTKQHYPALYEKIRYWVKKKRWEVSGGMWVEPDMNLTGAEALVRQIILGKRFTREEFGYETDVLWLPDVFGYSAALPQVLRKGGIRYFATIKLFWSDTNKPPYTSFWWEGIDGSRVLAHIPPNGDYNSELTAERLRNVENRYTERDSSDTALVPFGWGDGGGGPDLRHMELSRRYENCEGVPRVKMQFISDFFHTLEQQADNFPRWCGELYLETHRGTYTTQGATKRDNRRCEFLLRDVEFAAALAQDCDQAYPHDELRTLWQTVLKNQFHDILPGSSINEVYREAARDYARVLQDGAELRDRALKAVLQQIDTRGSGTPVVVFNSLPWARRVTVSLPLQRKRHGQVCPPGTDSEPVETVSTGDTLQFRADVPAMGYAVYRIDEQTPAEAGESRVHATDNRLENDCVRLRFDRHGLVRSLYDKTARRELVPTGEKLNVFQRFQDRPVRFDAWNIDRDALDTAVELTALDHVEVLQLGPLRGGIRQVRTFGKSSITQDIWLEEGSPQIHFDTRVDWHESWQLLKVAFPLELQVDYATHEIQFGHLRRPTSRNTSWDQARHETCAHKWVDLAEPDYGVALLNDSKYGHDIAFNVLRLTLLKSPKVPDESADMGEHAFSYALFPHTDDFRQAGVIQQAYEYNVPVQARLTAPRGGSLPETCSFLSTDDPAAIIETLKVEEDGHRWVVRLYESHGRRLRTRLHTAFPLAGVEECDLLERNRQPVRHQANSIAFELTPFEIKTFVLTFAD